MGRKIFCLFSKSTNGEPEHSVAITLGDQRLAYLITMFTELTQNKIILGNACQPEARPSAYMP